MKTAMYGSVQKRKTPNRPQYIMILIMKTLKRALKCYGGSILEPLVFGISRVVCVFGLHGLAMF